MGTRIINNIKYIGGINDNNLKLLSLEDNVYFTLRDIFNNISNVDYCMEANAFNSKLTNNVGYEDRDNTFQYTNILHDIHSIYDLNKWLKSIEPYDFEFEELDDNSNEYVKEWYYDDTYLVRFDIWWVQFKNLQKLIEKRLEEL